MNEMDEINAKFYFIKSYTTRKKRNDKLDKHSYNFISRNNFLNKIKNNLMFEYFINRNNGQYYGYEAADIKTALYLRRNILVIPTYHFLLNFKKFIKERGIKYCNIISIYLLPRSIEDIKRRILERHSENKEEIKIRIKSVEDDIKTAKYYDYKIINKESFETSNIIKNLLIKKLV
jgi:guanylate kinase